MIEAAAPKCFRYSYPEGLLNGYHLDGQSVFINSTLCVYLANIFCGLSAEDVRGLVLQKFLTCWRSSFFLSVAILKDFGFRLYVGFIQRDGGVWYKWYACFAAQYVFAVCNW